MNIKTGIIEITFKEETSFLDEIKVFTKREIWKCIIYK